ncbi:hypothetical protein RC62_29 [Flavobacterium aquidurense]|uniref:Uncharacterized protein n=1 Tax=Flavobacterium aquidurense TaxID=362413 RepID=A0A0Q0SFK4_9FLAO|nr:hypothetical protein RC62_29 [Flavobacterium aquidurense]
MSFLKNPLKPTHYKQGILFECKTLRIKHKIILKKPFIHNKNKLS